MRGGIRENIYIYIRGFITNLQETPWVDAKRNKVLLVSSADRPCRISLAIIIYDIFCSQDKQRNTICILLIGIILEDLELESQ